MDYQRIMLWFALFAVAFLLWTDWQREYQSQPPAKASATEQAQGLPLAPQPVATPAVTGANLVLPSTTQTKQAAVPADRLITVKTDVFTLKIDTRGGNIVGSTLTKFPKTLKNPQEPIDLLSFQPDQLYIIQSALVSPQGPDTATAQAAYTVEKPEYLLAKGDKDLVVRLHWVGKNGLRVDKIFQFRRGEYLVKISYQIINNSSIPWQGNLYHQIQRKEIKPEGSGWFQVHPYMGAAFSTQDERYSELSFKQMRTKPLDVSTVGGWLAMVQHYFVTAWVPEPHQINKFYSRHDDDLFTVGMVSKALSVAPKQQLTLTTRLYSGPEITETLKGIAPGLDLTVSYGWLWPISVVIFWLMKQINWLVGNWGWSIVIVTVLIKILFYPLSAKSFQSMAGMRKLQPKLETLRERYADDKQKLTQAMMELYRKEKINPMSGCLPILVQIPVFFALYMVLVESVELRQAPWILWIRDLSSPDPYYLLPILMGVTMLIQQRLNPPPPDPTQAKMMLLLPFLFTFLFIHFPSGLVLYWVVNNALQILQQWYVMNKFEQAYAKRQGTA